jgi:oligoribonuclease
LINACIQSTVTIEQAEDIVLNYLQERGIQKGELMIAGNSVHMDKLFLFHQMPKLDEFLHYRILDVTSVKTVVNAKNPSLFFMKKSTHRALDDIRESIGEL